MVVSTLDAAKPLGGQDLAPYMKAALYGDPGVGKTFSATDVKMDVYPIDHHEILFINIENGVLTLKVNGRRCRVLNVDKFDPQNKKDPFTHLEQVHRDLLAGTEVHGIKTVVIDTVSSLQKEDLDTVAEVTNDKAGGNAGNRLHGKFGKQQADYGINTDKMRWLLRAFRDLPMNVIFIFGSTKEKDNAGRVTTVPDITPKLRESFYPMVDVIGYMYKAIAPEGEPDAGQVRYMTLFDPSYTDYKLKDRSGALGAYQQNKTLPDFLRMVADKINETSQTGT